MTRRKETGVTPSVDTVRLQVLRWRRTVDAAAAKERMRETGSASQEREREIEVARLEHAGVVLEDVRRYIDGEFPLIVSTLPGEKVKVKTP